VRRKLVDEAEHNVNAVCNGALFEGC
jgi:hypothetical protein